MCNAKMGMFEPHICMNAGMNANYSMTCNNCNLECIINFKFKFYVYASVYRKKLTIKSAFV